MLFSSTLFLFLFLPIVLAGNLVLHPRLRNPWLLLSSLVFYAWGEPFVVLVMLLSVLANWALGLWVGSRRTGWLPLAATLVFNLGMLVFFKYADWLTTAASGLLEWFGAAPLSHLGAIVPRDWSLYDVLFSPQGSIRLPIGISFFTFQAMSYVIDVRRGDTPTQRNPFDLALYIALFPQLIAGPIVRYRDVAEQITSRVTTLTGFAYGIRRFVLGLAKKMLIANTAAKAADAIFAIPHEALPPSCAWLGIVCYTTQIYFDFSGYSDMAIGLGHLLGFRFLENFNYPYVSRSITEFWRRWHISLSTWFRDYLYIPMGGSRRGPARTYLHLVLVFTLCGLWHGASFSFLVWGLYHGLFLVLERRGMAAWLERRPRALRHVYVLLVAMVGWVFFRAETLGQALAYLGTMAGLRAGNPVVYHVDLYLDPVLATALSVALFAATPILPTLVRRFEAAAQVRESPQTILLRVLGLAGLAILFVVSCTLMAAGTYNPFIYFRF